MQVLQVKEYNRKMENKFHNDYAKYGRGERSGEPQIAFYLFYYNGQERQTGYVAFNDKSAVLRATKKEAIKEFLKNHEDIEFYQAF